VKRASRWRRAPGWWWRFPALVSVMAVIAVAIALAAAGVGAAWNHMLGELR